MENKKFMINVLLIDDHELVRSGFESLLNAREGINVVGVAATGEEGLELVNKLNPDVILLDIFLPPGISGVEVCKRILQRNPKARVIALTVRIDGATPQQILKLGAMGYISKGSSSDEMIDAIHQVMSGKRFLCKEVAERMALQSLPGGAEESPFDKLSNRESEVVSMILQGKNIQEMSTLLSLSDKTINTYRYRLYEKLGVKNDVELTCLAVKFNYIDGVLI